MSRPCEASRAESAIDLLTARTGAYGGEGSRVNAYLWLKLVHVLASIKAVGANLTYFFWLTMVRRSSEHSAYVLKGIRSLDARVANPAYIVLPVTGILMVLDAELGFPRSGSQPPSFCT